jgi:3-hydroxyacyl-[acyl-carrier-protein] dehydratase
MRLDYFQLIDRIVDLNLAERSISCEAIVPAESESTIFQGHFPGFPLMPGVLLIEAMAQTSGWLVVAVNEFKRMPFLAQVKDAKFRTFVTPGQKLSVSAKLAHEGSGYAVTNAKITLAGKPVCDATLTLRVMDFPNAEVSQKMRETAARVGFPSEVAVNG